MARRVVRPRAFATADIDDAIEHDLDEGGGQLAHRFVDALEHAVGQIQRSPLSGSQRFSFELGIPELRARALARLPYVIFYVVHSEVIDVWRVLHRRRDVLGAFRPRLRTRTTPRSDRLTTRTTTVYDRRRQNFDRSFADGLDPPVCGAPVE